MKNLMPFFVLSLIFYTSCQENQGRDYYINSIGCKMISIEAGNFRMGDLNNLGYEDEKPVRKINISRSFYISETEITVDQYQKYDSTFKDAGGYQPYTTGMSWHEANGFCKWLSEKEGKTYRLPTEAEWEYVCRAGTSTPFSSGNQIPKHETANDWGVRNMHTGVLEWCYDWYGPYPHFNQTDPIGRSWGFGKVIRGGLPDDKRLLFDQPVSEYARSANRASVAPAFKASLQPESEQESKEVNQNYDQFVPGLTGILYDDAQMKKPLSLWRVGLLNSDKISWKSLNDWSFILRGSIYAPTSGKITFLAEADNGIRLSIADELIIDGWGTGKSRTGEYLMEAGEKYPIKVAYFKDGGDSYMRLHWQWDGHSESEIPPDALVHNGQDQQAMEIRFSKALKSKMSKPSIGFRIVQAEMPDSRSLPFEKPMVMQGIKQSNENVTQGPDLSKPYFRKRYLLPVPPDNSEKKDIIASGLHHTFYEHIHDPGFEVCDNGDLLVVLFTSVYEDEPEVSLLAVRFRYGADQWDMPSPFVDQADVNDVAPMLWNDTGKLNFYFGNIHLDGAYPFQWTTSMDNGATWSDIKYPHFITAVGPHTAQPINSAFRDKSNHIYIACDGLGATSVLYTSSDDGNTWADNGGRSGGRHTSFILLKDGTILGMGGKHSDIDGFMPQSRSEDGGKTWQLSKTPFAALGTNQRPTIIRLNSGRLFMAGDFQRIDGVQPPGINQRGSYVALSSDEGDSWTIKKLAGGQPHESEERRSQMRGETIGYAVARQAPNGMIHLIATMTHPCLHYEFNEAWILSEGDEKEIRDPDLMTSRASKIANIKEYREMYPDGKIRLKYHAGTADDGRFLLNGNEFWYYPDGRIQYEANYSLGQKTGKEMYWNREGKKIWHWEYHEDGSATWIQWWPNNKMKSRSHWKNKMCDGKAECWDFNGELINEVIFRDGFPLDE